MEQKETLLKRLEENKVAADAPKIASLKNELEEVSTLFCFFGQTIFPFVFLIIR